ncbi:MAG: BlaI/MecI/CopY family transcriptional regulator [Tannerella sp.]|jgi:predicted transcriptional regulator|nr:BlaI/MecI/CopY family transcriptional regulator [Tannerella sp.]
MQLTKAEEQVMQYLWDLEEGIVQQVRDCFKDPKPSRTTVSTILRILETKGFIGHKGVGRVYTYFPLIRKEDYSKHQLFGMLKNYFNNSFASMASFFAKESDMNLQEMEALLEEAKKEFNHLEK